MSGFYRVYVVGAQKIVPFYVPLEVLVPSLQTLRELSLPSFEVTESLRPHFKNWRYLKS